MEGWLIDRPKALSLAAMRDAIQPDRHRAGYLRRQKVLPGAIL